MATLVRTTFRWSIMSGAESAVVTCSSFDATAAFSAFVSAHNANQNTLWQSLRGIYHTSTSMLPALLQRIDIATGQVIETVEAAGPTNPAGTQTNGPLPPQIACVLSVKTALSGPRNRGRMYLPPPDRVVLVNTGLLDGGIREDIVDAWASYFIAVDTASGFELGVYSRVAAAFAPATAINMGTVFDTMRSRRSELVESRYQVSV